jgi:hypothetical protein
MLNTREHVRAYEDLKGPHTRYPNAVVHNGVPMDFHVYHTSPGTLPTMSLMPSDRKHFSTAGFHILDGSKAKLSPTGKLEMPHEHIQSLYRSPIGQLAIQHGGSIVPRQMMATDGLPAFLKSVGHVPTGSLGPVFMQAYNKYHKGTAGLRKPLGKLPGKDFPSFRQAVATVPLAGLGPPKPLQSSGFRVGASG